MGSSFAQISADFSSPTIQACGSLQTTFFDQSISDQSIISWSWDLGGNTSSQQNPGAIFTDPGNYTICLTVVDVDGNTDTECKENYITILPNPIPSFESDTNEGCAPVNVVYTDLSTSENGPIISWLWGIGGTTGVINTTDTSQIITSSYTTGGNYTASLTIVDSLGCTATTSVPNFINVYQIPEPNITTELISSCQLPWSIQFTNTNADPDVDYLWDFGNGSTYSGIEPPVVEYSNVGEYDVTVFMSSGDCKDTLLLESFIDTDATSDFSYAPDPACQNTPIQFTDESVVTADSVLWDFGDGSTSNAFDPIHTYQNEGCYDIIFIRFAEECSDTLHYSCLEILPSPELEITIENQFNCTLPTTVILQGNSVSSGSYTWSLEGTNTSVSADSNNVPIQIDEFGSYFVDVTFTDSLGCGTTENSIPIQIQPFEAHLPSIGPSGCAPLTFTLIDSVITSTNIVNWEWTVGSPEIYSSTSQNPTFTISDTGRYDVQLIVENSNGCIDTVFVEDYIRVGMVPEVNFEATPLLSCIEVIKEFTDLSSSYADEWEWIFENGFITTKQNPTVSFGDAGVYDVTLIATHNGCSDSLTFENYISILEPKSNFNIEYNCDNPYQVNINNTSKGADSLYWTLKLSETDSLFFTDSIFGSYTLPDRGNYLLSHYSKNFESGCEHVFTDTIKIVDPIASYTLDTLRGCAPLEIQLGDFSQDAFQYEYLSDEGTIDSVFNSEPSIVFTEGGFINGPLLIITDIHECKDSFQLMDSIIINKLDAFIEFPEVICVPDVVELVDQSTNTLGNNIRWEWNIGNGEFESSSQDTSIYIDSVGMYDVYFKVEDDWGCKDSINLSMAINAVEIIPDFSSDTLGCTWAPISFTAMGTNGYVVAFNWDFGDGNTSTKRNPQHEYAQEGVYTVCLSMSDSRGCSKEICKENVVTIIDPNADFTGDPIFATCPPLLSNFSNQSEDAVSYIWDFGDNSGLSENESPSHVYTSPGVFDVMLIASSTSSCSDTLLLEGFVRVEGPTADFTFDISPSCLPVTVDLFAQSDGYYSYTWDYGNGVLDSVGGLVISDTTSYVYNETGIFTPKIIITDSIGCSRSFAGEPIIVNDVQLEFQKDAEPQCGPPLEVFLYNESEGTTEDVSYFWNLIGPQNIESSEESPVFTISESGTYNVQLIAQYDNCIDTLSKVDFLEIADIPDVSFEIETDNFCEDVNAHFVNTSTVEYGEFSEWYWDFGDGTVSNEENPTHQYIGLDSRTITLIGITDKGCEAKFTNSFDVLPSMIGQVGEDELICIGDMVQLSSNIPNLLEGGSYYWEGDNTLSCIECFDPVVSPQSTSSFVFVAVHPNGCESRDTVEVTVIPTPGPELNLLSDSIICLGTESVIDVVNFDESYQYIWNTAIPGQDCYENCDEVTVQPDSFTTYFVTVYNEFGCYKSDSISIDVETSFVEFVPAARAICEGESTTIELTAGNNPMWLPDPDISCVTCSEIDVTPSDSKKYYIEVESDLGCTYLDSVHIIIVPDQSVFAGQDQEVCVGEYIELNAVGYGQANWSPAHIMVDSSQFNTQASPDSSGYITLTMTYDECAQSDSLYVEVYDKAEISAVGDSICSGEVGLLTVDGRADSFLWQVNTDKENFSNQMEMIADETQYIEVIGTYRTCQPDTAEAILYVYPNVDYILTEQLYILHLNDEIKIQSLFDSTRNYQYEWIPQTGLDCVDCPNPRISGLLEHTEYSLKVMDLDSGCESDYEINVRFQNECTQTVFHLPNVFTPDASGANSQFKLSTKNPEEFISMSIFDRWGNLVYTSKNIHESWNGKIGTQDAETGVYVYKIDLVCPITNENYVILGDITLLR